MLKGNRGKKQKQVYSNELWMTNSYGFDREISKTVERTVKNHESRKQLRPTLFQTRAETWKSRAVITQHSEINGNRLIFYQGLQFPIIFNIFFKLQRNQNGITFLWEMKTCNHQNHRNKLGLKGINTWMIRHLNSSRQKQQKIEKLHLICMFHIFNLYLWSIICSAEHRITFVSVLESNWYARSDMPTAI